MADIFISYASRDREKARALAASLAARGWSAWWDREIPLGQTFDAVIEKALGEARCLIVLWSTQSIESKWVRNEASEGESRGILLPVFIEAVQAPLAFRRLNGANLQDWEPGSPHPELERLLERVSEMLGQGAGAATTTAAPAELLGDDHEPPIDQKPFPWPRVSPGRAFAVVVAVLGLIWGSYLLVDHGPMRPPALTANGSGKPSGAGTSVTTSGVTSATAPAMQTVPERPLGHASTVASGVGQIALNWNGANRVGWKVLDADKKNTLRNSSIGAKRSESEDLPPGDYVVALDAKGFQPIPLTVRAGQASPVTPAVGQITLNWNGANRVGWKVLDANKKNTLRNSSTGAKTSESEDLPPGDYVVALDAKGFQPIPVTVRNGQASPVTPAVGQITLNWNSANRVGWKVLDADKKNTLRNSSTGAKTSESEDLPPGDYVVALDAKGFQPIPVTVRNGQASTVTP